MTKMKVAMAISLVAVFLLLSTGVALALTQTCDLATCEGTSGKDNLTGIASDNLITGKAGNDTISDTQGQDKDTIRGNRGNDNINVREGNSASNNKDFVNCGAGNDTVFTDSNDVVVHCEHVNPDKK